MTNLLFDIFNSFAGKGDTTDTGKEVNSTQYLCDNGKVCRRGLCRGGIQIWESLESGGLEHFAVGPVPGFNVTYGIDSPLLKSGGLYIAGDIRLYDEVTAAMVTPAKVQDYWKLADGSTEEENKVLHDTCWHWHTWVRILDNKEGTWILDKPEGSEIYKIRQLRGGNPATVPKTADITLFKFPKPFIEYIKRDSVNLVYSRRFSNLGVIGFSGPEIGGIVAGYLSPKDHVEKFNVLYKETVYEYKQTENTIKLKGAVKMEFKNMPKLSELNEKSQNEKARKETTNPKVEPEEVEKPEVVMHKGRLERVDGKPLVEETSKSATEQIRDSLRTEAEDYVEEQRAAENSGLGATPEPTVEQLFEDLMKKAEDAKLLASAVFRDLKPLAKEVKRLQKGAGNSDEVKALKLENKELQKKLKETEKELAKRTTALKALVGGDSF